MNSWILTVESDEQSGDYMITLPPDLLKQTGWKIGDHIIWKDRGDGSYELIVEDLTSFVKKGTINNEQN